MGQDVIMWSAVCFSKSHSQAAVRAIPHLYNVERNKPTPVRSRLSLTQNGLDRYFPRGLGLTSGMKVRRQEALLCHSVFYLVSA